MPTYTTRTRALRPDDSGSIITLQFDQYDRANDARKAAHEYIRRVWGPQFCTLTTEVSR